MMFLLVSVVSSTWCLGLGVIGPHSHLEKTGEWRSLGTFKGSWILPVILPTVPSSDGANDFTVRSLNTQGRR